MEPLLVDLRPRLPGHQRPAAAGGQDRPGKDLLLPPGPPRRPPVDPPQRACGAEGREAADEAGDGHDEGHLKRQAGTGKKIYVVY